MAYLRVRTEGRVLIVRTHAQLVPRVDLVLTKPKIATFFDQKWHREPFLPLLTQDPKKFLSKSNGENIGIGYTISYLPESRFILQSWQL